MKYVIVLLACIPLMAIAQSNQTADNPFGATSNQQKAAARTQTHRPAAQRSTPNCSNLPTRCADIADCADVQRALKCGMTRLDRDNDGVACESLCR